MEDAEYVSSVSLLFLGDFDPDEVSGALSLTPSQVWRVGEKKSVPRSDGSMLVFESRHARSGWKMWADPDVKDQPLEAQFAFWCALLKDRIEVIATFKSRGIHCVLDIFMTTSATASIILSSPLQNALSALGLELELSFFAHPDPPDQK